MSGLQELAEDTASIQSKYTHVFAGTSVIKLSIYEHNWQSGPGQQAEPSVRVLRVELSAIIVTCRDQKSLIAMIMMGTERQERVWRWKFDIRDLKS